MATFNAKALLYITVPLVFLVILVVEIKSLFYNCSPSDNEKNENINSYEIKSNADSIGLRTVAYTNKYSASTSIPSLNPDLPSKVISSKIFDELISTATNHPRKRKMVDLTRDPPTNTMQTLMNTWINGSFSPVHKHTQYSEAFVVLKGALAFFTYSPDGSEIRCNVLTDGAVVRGNSNSNSDRAIIVEKNQWHAMTAAPTTLGYPGVAIIFEMSGHKYDTSVPTKVLAPFAPVYGDGLNGDPVYFDKILKLCPKA